MPTIVKEPVKRSECNLCGKSVAELPNGRLRYHSCHVDPATRPVAEQRPQGYGAGADGNLTPRSEAILAQPTKEVPSTMTSATVAPAAAEDESQEVPDEGVSQEAPAEVTLGGKTVEDAAPGKPKREKAPKEPKAEPKVPESVIKARAERTALLERSKAISKVAGTGDKTKVTLHMYDTEADRTLCGAVVPANEESRKAQGWYADNLPAELVKAAEGATECSTCQARMTKLQAGGSIRRRVARKPGEAEIGTPIVKAAKGTKDEDVQGVVHLTNAASEPLRTLCGAIIGSEAEGWVPAEDAGVEIGCPTCKAREAKLVAAAETDKAMAESKNGSAG